MSESTGRLAGIACRPERLAPMVTLERVAVSAETGLEGDHQHKHPNRLVSLLSREAWEAALDALDPRPNLPWTTRRANLLVEGVDLPQAAGWIVTIGPVILEVTCETEPCALMEKSHPGLRAALAPDWRGGVCCTVRRAGTIALGDPVTVSAHSS